MKKQSTLIIALIILVLLILYLWGIEKIYPAIPDTSYCGFPDKETHDEVAYWIEYHGIRFQDDCWTDGNGVYWFRNKDGEKCRLLK